MTIYYAGFMYIEFTVDTKKGWRICWHFERRTNGLGWVPRIFLRTAVNHGVKYGIPNKSSPYIILPWNVNLSAGCIAFDDVDRQPALLAIPHDVKQMPGMFLPQIAGGSSAIPLVTFSKHENLVLPRFLHDSLN